VSVAIDCLLGYYYANILMRLFDGRNEQDNAESNIALGKRSGIFRAWNYAGRFPGRLR
jgi:hypothetical protein